MPFSFCSSAQWALLCPESNHRVLGDCQDITSRPRQPSSQRECDFLLLLSWQLTTTWRRSQLSCRVSLSLFLYPHIWFPFFSLLLKRKKKKKFYSTSKRSNNNNNNISVAWRHLGRPIYTKREERESIRCTRRIYYYLLLGREEVCCCCCCCCVLHTHTHRVCVSFVFLPFSRPPTTRRSHFLL